MLVVFGRARDFSNFLTAAPSPRFRNLHRMRSGIPRHRLALAMRQLVFRKWDNSFGLPLVEGAQNPKESSIARGITVATACTRQQKITFAEMRAAPRSRDDDAD